MILRDPVHGLISFEAPAERIVVQLLDTPEVQRLRRIRALGPASLAFPGGEHSRFAHAVGSAHVMKRYLDRVKALATEIPASAHVDAETASVALAAAVLHDLGHGPYSHSFEGLGPGQPSHETWTSRIILDPQTSVHQILRGLDPAAPRAVERLIHGEHPIDHLARAVSGTFDVDRCDYLMRDSQMTGVRYGLLDLEWLLRSLRLTTTREGSPVALAVDGEKGLTAVEGFFLARLYMYRQVYLHKAVRAAETVFRALFRRLADLGPEAPHAPEAVARILAGDETTVGAYLDLDDATIHTSLAAWEGGSDPVLSDLAARIRHRRLFKSLPLRMEADAAAVGARLEEVLHAAGLDPRYYGQVDRVEVDAYTEDEALAVLSFGRSHALLEASQVLHDLSRAPFVHYRVIFPEMVRDEMTRALEGLSG